MRARSASNDTKATVPAVGPVNNRVVGDLDAERRHNPLESSEPVDLVSLGPDGLSRLASVGPDSDDAGCDEAKMPTGPGSAATLDGIEEMGPEDELAEPSVIGRDVSVGSRTPARRRTVAHLLGTIAGAAIVLAAVGAITLLAWPEVSLRSSEDALALMSLPPFAGRVDSVSVNARPGASVPVRIRDGKIWPVGHLPCGQRLTVELTVRRPGWAAWLVGQRKVSRFTIRTPVAQLRTHLVVVKVGDPVGAVFDMPVQLVAIGGAPARRLASPRTVVSLGVVAHGVQIAGEIQVAAAARSWESLPAPTSVRWFAKEPYPQMLVSPATTATLGPSAQLTLTFSEPVATVFGAARPLLSPAVAGHWAVADAHTLVFTPGASGFGLGTTERVELPKAVHVIERSGIRLTRSLRWQVASGSKLRLEQLLAQLGYLPLSWQPAGDVVASASPAAQLAAAVLPPPGEFSWTYPETPAELRRLWRVGHSNEILRAAVMVFEDTHGMPADGVAGPKVWSTLIGDVSAGKSHIGGYSYVFVHRNVPQLLSLWHNGRVIFTSPGNTGVPAAPTQLGTFPVFEHIPVGTMSGTNPDGSRYKDPGIRYISYFNGGEALHSFNRSSFGTPQSLGCVELPLAAAAKVWPYTPIGTLVTIEN